MNILRIDKDFIYKYYCFNPIDYNRYNMDDLTYNNNEARRLTSFRIVR